MDDMRIYVVCLASYNAGKLYGEWFDLDDYDGEVGLGDLLAAIKVMLDKSPVVGEEWAIHDNEGFGPYRVGEYENLWDLVRLSDAVQEHGEAMLHYAADVELEYALESFDEAFNGIHDSEEDYAEELTASLHNIRDTWFEYYIDYQAMARDLFMSDYTSHDLSNGDVAVFRVM